MPKYVVFPPEVPGKPHISRIEHFNDLGDAIEYVEDNEEANLEIAEVLDQDGWFFKFLKWLQKL